MKPQIEKLLVRRFIGMKTPVEITLVGGGTVKVRFDEVKDYEKVCARCLEQLGLNLDPMENAEWCRVFDKAYVRGRGKPVETLEELRAYLAAWADRLDEMYVTLTVDMLKDYEGFPQLPPGDLADALDTISETSAALTQVCFSIGSGQIK